MDGKFLALVGLLSTASFGGIWVATEPAASISLQPATTPVTTAPAKRKLSFVVEAPPEDTQPVSAYGDAPKRARRGAGVYFAGCNAAWAAGAAPIHRGEPGYRPEMDGDNDGIACEPHRR
jgi:hypothetical protein